MKALLFPGQGVQRVGMLDKLFRDVPEIKNVIATYQPTSVRFHPKSS